MENIQESAVITNVQVLYEEIDGKDTYNVKAEFSSQWSEVTAIISFGPYYELAAAKEMRNILRVITKSVCFING